MKPDVIIPVKNREVARVNRCIQSIDRLMVNNIIVVDYGSYDLDLMKGVNADKLISISSDDCPVWNKSHALNLAIKNFSKSQYIICLDCDIILPDDLFVKVNRIVKSGDYFIFGNKTKRVNIDFNNYQSYEELLKLSRDWTKDIKFSRWSVGGLQIFPKWWIEKVGGYDETMIYWGGMDTDLFYRAMQTIDVVCILDTLLHQDHDKIKFDHLRNTDELNYAKILQTQRGSICDDKCRKGIIIQDRWGEIE